MGGCAQGEEGDGEGKLGRRIDTTISHTHPSAMPVLLDERIITLEFADLHHRSPIVRPTQPPTRDPGMHQSDILAYIARNIGELKPGEPLEEDMPWRMALGVMWEEFYFSLIPESDWQPGEIVQDGIAVNCDGITSAECISINPWGENLIEETKCTEKKVKTGEEFLAEWMWMHQGRAYGETYSPEIVRWSIMYYRGNYAGSGPICKQYTVRFSPREIKQTWQMLLKNKQAASDALVKEAADKYGQFRTVCVEDMAVAKQVKRRRRS